MRRAFVVYLFVVLFLALFGGFAWLTRFPEAEILRRAQAWPWIGPAATAFRDAYLPRDRRAEIETEDSETEMLERIVSERPPAATETISVPRIVRPPIWALAGMELKAEPSADAATLHRFEGLSRAGKIERRGDWYRVDYNGRVGWVLLEGYDENAEVPYGETPEPPRPLPGRAPDSEALADARRYLRGRERALALGPYTLYTDCRDDGLIAHLDRVAGGLEATYVERYGRTPAGDAAEAVVLFESDIAYRLVQRRSGRLVGLDSAGHVAGGLVVLYSGGRSRAAVAGTVIHELVHLLNRRAIGPHLPPWLDEGIADDLALSRVAADGRIDPDELGGEHHSQDGGWRIEGGHASLLNLRDAAISGELPALRDLIRADWESFVEPPKSRLHYAAAAFWIRFLVAGEGGRHAAGFRAFLDAVAEGEPPDAKTLGKHLDADWRALDTAFRVWLQERAAGVAPRSKPAA